MFDDTHVIKTPAHRIPSPARGRYFALGLVVAALIAVPVFMSRPAPASPPAAPAGSQGPEGPQGIPGRDPTQEEIAAAVAAYLAEHPPQNGRNGLAGPSGVQGVPGRPPTADEIAAAVAAYFAAHPTPAPSAVPDPGHTPAA